MNQASNHKIHVLLALFLSTVFLSTFLVKPVHILFVHHHSTTRTTVNSGQIAFTTEQESNCPICDFEFCAFLAANSFECSNVPVVFGEKLISRPVHFFIYHTSLHFQLRAPPIV